MSNQNDILAFSNWLWQKTGGDQSRPVTAADLCRWLDDFAAARGLQEVELHVRAERAECAERGTVYLGEIAARTSAIDTALCLNHLDADNVIEILIPLVKDLKRAVEKELAKQ